MPTLQPIQFKRSLVSGSVPSAADVLLGELVMNIADGRLYTHDGLGNIVELGFTSSYDSDIAYLYANSSSGVNQMYDSEILVLHSVDSDYGILLFKVIHDNAALDSDFRNSTTQLANYDSDIIALKDADSDILANYDSDIIALKDADSDILASIGTQVVTGTLTDVEVADSDRYHGAIVTWDSDLSKWVLGQVPVYNNTTDYYSSVAGLTSFVLSKDPVGEVNVFINGVLIQQTAYTFDPILKTVTYIPANNNGYALVSGDDVSITYVWGSSVASVDNGNAPYSPTTSSDWATPAPSTIGEALDRLATVVKTLNGGTGA